MPMMNFDLEDGLSPVSFNLKPDDCLRFMAFMAECQAIKDAPPAAQPVLVSGVVIRDGLPTLLRDSDIKSTDQRLCVISPAAQPAQPKEPVSNDEITAWAERHDIQGTLTDLRCMFEDAASVNAQPAAQPAPVQEPVYKEQS